MEFGTAITRVGEIIDILGVIAIVVGVLYAMADAAVRRLRRTGPVYTRFRRVLGRGILIGLELLVAADIIRTFLSWSLEVEISGRWPWQKARAGAVDADADSEAAAGAEPASAPPARP